NGSGKLSDVRLRRNVVVDAYSDASNHSQGLFADGVNGLLLEGNVFDHNGWSERVANAPATIFNHNLYLTVRTTGVVATGNVFANAGDSGVPWQAGGFAAIGLSVGDGANDADLAAGVRDLRIEGNVVRRWAKGITMSGDMSGGAGGTRGYSGLVVKRNEFSRI